MRRGQVARRASAAWASAPVEEVVALVLRPRRSPPRLQAALFSRAVKEVRTWLEQARGWTLYRIQNTSIVPLDESTVLVTGRIQRMTDRMLRDSPAVWLLEVRDGMVFTSRTYSSADEARREFARRHELEAGA